MRKRGIPKSVYVIWITLLLFLSIGYTYAYFSALDSVTTQATVYNINVTWRDENKNDALLGTWFNDTSNIAITSELVRGKFVSITATNKSSQQQNVKLKMANLGSTGAYCRIKIVATYTNNGGVEKTCEDGWIQLALNTGGSTPTLITSSGWFYSNGYYYYGTNINNLTELGKNTGVTVADNIKLSETSSADIYGSTLKIVLKLEAAQKANNGYKYVWGLI